MCLRLLENDTIHKHLINILHQQNIQYNMNTFKNQFYHSNVMLFYILKFGMCLMIMITHRRIFTITYMIYCIPGEFLAALSVQFFL